MNKLQSYVLNNFSLVDRYIDADQLTNFFKQNSSKFSMGFQVVDAKLNNNNGLEVEIVKRSPTYLFDFDDESRKMVKKESFLFTTAFFEINLNKSYLLTYGGLSQNNDVKLFLKRVGMNFDIGQLYVDISSFYFSTNLKYKNIQLKGISIKKFNYRNGMVGRFSGVIVDTVIVTELLTSYSKDVLKATFSIDNEENKFDLQIFPNGAFKILTDEGQHREVLDDMIDSLLI